MDKVIARHDRDIRSGQADLVRDALLALSPKKIPRPQLALWAWLSWRAGRADLGVRWLNPIVRPKPRSPLKATPREKAEYAACLIRLGAVDEALAILEKLSPRQVPQTLIYRVFGLVPQWRYAESIPLLNEVLKTAEDPYDRLVANVNLAAALIAVRSDEKAVRLLERLEREAERGGNNLLLGNVRELLASVAVRVGRWDEAIRRSKNAGRDLSAQGGVFALLIEKWGALAALGLSPQSGHARAKLEKVRAKARMLGHWESLRDCDRFEAIIRKDTPLFLRAYFGTPFPAFRERLAAEFFTRMQLPEHYACPLTDGAAGAVLDLTRPIGAAAPGSQSHRLLCLLASDFYRPFPPVQLHARLFPGDYFNPGSSPHRVAEAMHRLRHLLAETVPTLKVRRTRGGYRLVAETPLTLRVGLRIARRGDPELAEVSRALGDRAFSISETIRVLKLPRRTVARRLKAWTESGLITRTGGGHASRYVIGETFPYRTEEENPAAKAEAKEA